MKLTMVTNREYFGISSLSKFLECLFNFSFAFLSILSHLHLLEFLLLLTLLNLQMLQLLLLPPLPFLICGCFLCVSQQISSLVLLLRSESKMQLEYVEVQISEMIYSFTNGRKANLNFFRSQ